MKKHSTANADKSRHQPVLVNGHEYPFDPTSEEFTDMLMDCFQRGREVVAEKQKLMSLATNVTRHMPDMAEKLSLSRHMARSLNQTKVRTRKKPVSSVRLSKAQPKLKHA
jgi:hypothetical protein